MTAISRIRNLTRATMIGVVSVFVVSGAYLGFLQLTGNFNTVVSGELYRSGQITPQQLDEYATKYGIKTIINLRGSNPGNTWYDAETAESKKLHIYHVDFGLSARREVTEQQAADLIALLRSSPKPILIHCKAGADRSGFVSALYLAAIKKWRPKVAEGQLSIRYGHLSLPFIPEYAMDRSFETLALSSGTWGPE
jgi:protein tyrosine/serine phosphatase